MQGGVFPLWNCKVLDPSDSVDSLGGSGNLMTIVLPSYEKAPVGVKGDPLTFTVYDLSTLPQLDC